MLACDCIIYYTGQFIPHSVADLIKQGGHLFSVMDYTSHTWCEFCGGLLFGLCEQGLQCKSKLSVHTSRDFTAINSAPHLGIVSAHVQNLVS